MSKAWQVAIGACCVLFVGAIFLTVLSIRQNNSLAQRTRDALIDACETNRGPVQTYFQSRLAESERHGLHYYQVRFPTFPPGELQRAIERERDNLRAVVEVYDPTACEDQYR